MSLCGRMCDGQGLVRARVALWKNSKDPSVLRIVRRASSQRREKFGTEAAKRYGECSEVLVFPGKRGRKAVQIVKTTAVAKYYGFGRRTIFSTEGSFGNTILGNGANTVLGSMVSNTELSEFFGAH